TGISSDDSDFLTSQAMALASLIEKDREVAALYRALEGRFEWVFGPSEDLTVADLAHAAEEQRGASVRELRASLLGRARQEGRQPSIFSGIVDAGLLEKGVGVRDVLTGWRCLPQRFTPDSAAFQELVYDRVTGYRGKG